MRINLITYLLCLSLLALVLSPAYGQTNPNVITFEGNADISLSIPIPAHPGCEGTVPNSFNPSEGDQFDNTLNDIFDCYYGVKFFLEDLSGFRTPPTIAEIGDQGYDNNGDGQNDPYAFSRQDPAMYPPCGIMTDTRADLPNVQGVLGNSGETIGCFFLTDDPGVNANPLSLVIEYSIPTFQTSGFLLDIDGEEKWEITAYDAANTLIGSPIVLCSSLANPTGCTTTAIVGEGLATYWQFNLNQQIAKLQFSYIGTGLTIGLGFDNFSSTQLLEPLEDCASTNGLQTTSTSPEEPAGGGDCCHLLDYNNTGSNNVYAIELSLLDGVEFQLDDIILEGSLSTYEYNINQIKITNTALGIMPTNINGMINFCLQNITAIPQFLVIDYLGDDYETVICSDTLTFECPIQSQCLEYVLDSLVCDTLGYKYTIDFIVPPGTDFDIGYIKFNLDSQLPAGSFVEPIGAFADPAENGHIFPTPLQPGDQVSLMYIVNTSVDLFGDSLCVIVTAHDDIEERLCCFAYEGCLPYPFCPMPCDNVEASVVPAYQGEAAVCCDDDPRDYGWLQDLVGDCAALPCGAVVSCCEYEGQRVIVIEDDVELCSDPFAVVYDCQGGVIFQYGGVFAINLDLAENITGCQIIYDCFEPATDECCFDLLITDTYTDDLGLFTAIQTTIITPGVSFSGHSYLSAIINGWTPTDIVADQDILWTHSSGITPNGVDDYLFTFCIEGTISTDSVYVEVDWLNQDSVICTDTVAVYCPYCLQIVNDSLSCNLNAQGVPNYLYQFSFINSSAFDVNAVRILDNTAMPGVVGNPGVYMLGTTVPPGGTYAGFISVDLNGLEGEEVCFDIVLRQIIGEDINITCCYATHCVDLLPCDELPDWPCINETQINDLICDDVFDPVCGCDDVTYANICFAQLAGVTDWVDGPCELPFVDGGGVILSGQLAEGGVQLNWATGLLEYDFFVVRGRWPTENDFKSIAIIPYGQTSLYEFLHLNSMPGLNEYQILGITPEGLIAPSNIVEVMITETMALTTVYAYPNPVTDQIYVTANRNGSATMELITPEGQIHYTQQAEFNGSPISVSTSQLAEGVFIIRLRFDDGEVAQRRIVKLRP